MAKDDWKQSIRGAFNAEQMFYTEAERNNGTLDEMEIDQIVPFKEHTFKVVDDDKMQELVESIKDHGVNEPAVVFLNEDGNYEMVAGHRRKRACELAGIETIPVIVKNINRDEATILMGESNLQSREEILPSEKAFTYKKMLDAMNRQGKRTDLTSSPLGTKLVGTRSNVLLSEEVGESKSQIHRYIRLTYLIPELLNLVDQGKMSIRPAVEVSYIDSEGQKSIYDYYQDTLDIDDAGKEISPGVLPSLAQAKEMRDLAANMALDEEQIGSILGKLKPNQKPKLTLKDEKILRYGKNLTPKEFEDKILKALDFYEKHMEKNRDSRTI
jgi:ParB-like chromosome segregation protein Spo0J